MDDTPLEGMAIDEKWPDWVKKRIVYESGKGILKRFQESKPDLLVMDFVGSARMPLLVDGDRRFSCPYELFDLPDSDKEKFLARFQSIPFGSKEYFDLFWPALEKFCSFMNAHFPFLPIVVVCLPSAETYRGSSKKLSDFQTWYFAGAMRYMAIKGISKIACSLLRHATFFEYPAASYCDDGTLYGASPSHYSEKLWAEIGENYGQKYKPKKVNNTDSLDEMKREVAYISNLICLPENAMMASGFKNYQAIDAIQKIAPIMRPLGYHQEGNPAAQYEAYLRATAPTAEHIIFAYIFLLGRLPESIDAILYHLSKENLADLRHDLTTSDEFLNLINHNRSITSQEDSLPTDEIYRTTP